MRILGEEITLLETAKVFEAGEEDYEHMLLDLHCLNLGCGQVDGDMEPDFDFNFEEDDNILVGRFFDLSVADREEKNKIEQEHMVWKAAGEDNVETDMEQVSQPEIHAEEICDIN